MLMVELQTAIVTTRSTQHSTHQRSSAALQPTEHWLQLNKSARCEATGLRVVTRQCDENKLSGGVAGGGLGVAGNGNVFGYQLIETHRCSAGQSAVQRQVPPAVPEPPRYQHYRCNSEAICSGINSSPATPVSPLGRPFVFMELGKAEVKASFSTRFQFVFVRLKLSTKPKFVLGKAGDEFYVYLQVCCVFRSRRNWRGAAAEFGLRTNRAHNTDNKTFIRLDLSGEFKERNFSVPSSELLKSQLFKFSIPIRTSHRTRLFHELNVILLEKLGVCQGMKTNKRVTATERGLSAMSDRPHVNIRLARDINLSWTYCAVNCDHCSE
ncbi:hypothetical protein J6590_028350 [Homalodisca vitripennis]|nr:hypothetical protein J6590_028350 [Homalodisca vitripennis]